ncbi:MAG: hypothetical protein MHM6MM_002127 [Cercozoa sp. M6MM]
MLSAALALLTLGSLSTATAQSCPSAVQSINVHFQHNTTVPFAPPASNSSDYGDPNWAVMIEWTPPASDGGAALTHYIGEVSVNGGPWDRGDPLAANETSALFENGKPGDSLVFRLGAMNSDNETVCPTWTNSSVFRLERAAFPPREVFAHAHDRHVVEVAWSDPADSGLPTLMFEVMAKSENASTWSIVHTEIVSGNASSNTSNFHAVNLTDVLLIGKSYLIGVRAVNSLGASEVHEADGMVNTADEPDAPSDIEASLVNTTHVRVQWKKPADFGGAALLKYEVRAFAGEHNNGTLPPAPIVLEGIDNSTESLDYTWPIALFQLGNLTHMTGVVFAVYAVTEAGVGDFGFSDVLILFPDGQGGFVEIDEPEIGECGNVPEAPFWAEVTHDRVKQRLQSCNSAACEDEEFFGATNGSFHCDCSRGLGQLEVTAGDFNASLQCLFVNATGEGNSTAQFELLDVLLAGPDCTGSVQTAFASNVSSEVTEFLDSMPNYAAAEVTVGACSGHVADDNYGYAGHWHLSGCDMQHGCQFECRVNGQAANDTECLSELRPPAFNNTDGGDNNGTDNGTDPGDGGDDHFPDVNFARCGTVPDEGDEEELPQWLDWMHDQFEHARQQCNSPSCDEGRFFNDTLSAHDCACVEGLEQLLAGAIDAGFDGRCSVVEGSTEQGGSVNFVEPHLVGTDCQGSAEVAFMTNYTGEMSKLFDFFDTWDLDLIDINDCSDLLAQDTNGGKAGIWRRVCAGACEFKCILEGVEVSEQECNPMFKPPMNMTGGDNNGTMPDMEFPSCGNATLNSSLIEAKHEAFESLAPTCVSGNDSDIVQCAESAISSGVGGVCECRESALQSWDTGVSGFELFCLELEARRVDPLTGDTVTSLFELIEVVNASRCGSENGYGLLDKFARDVVKYYEHELLSPWGWLATKWTRVECDSGLPVVDVQWRTNCSVNATGAPPCDCFTEQRECATHCVSRTDGSMRSRSECALLLGEPDYTSVPCGDSCAPAEWRPESGDSCFCNCGAPGSPKQVCPLSCWRGSDRVPVELCANATQPSPSSAPNCTVSQQEEECYGGVWHVQCDGCQCSSGGANGTRACEALCMDSLFGSYYPTDESFCNPATKPTVSDMPCPCAYFWVPNYASCQSCDCPSETQTCPGVCIDPTGAQVNTSTCTLAGEDTTPFVRQCVRADLEECNGRSFEWRAMDCACTCDGSDAGSSTAECDYHCVDQADGHVVFDALCQDPRPTASVACDGANYDRDCGVSFPGTWHTVQDACDCALQLRLTRPVCRNATQHTVPETACNPHMRPPFQINKCTECDVEWRTWGLSCDCSTEKGTRNVGCFNTTSGASVDDSLCPIKSKPFDEVRCGEGCGSWTTDDWFCLCGNLGQVRNVYCENSATGLPLPDGACSGSKPAVWEATCDDTSDCSGGSASGAWALEWSACLRNANGSGCTRTSSSQCYDTSTALQVADDACDSDEKPPAETQVCQCDPVGVYEAGDWTCDCASGYATRPVTCSNVDSEDQIWGSYLPSKFCTGERPVARATCVEIDSQNRQYNEICPSATDDVQETYVWSTSAWSCNCANYKARRKVHCRDSAGEITEFGNCDSMSKPSHLGRCDEVFDSDPCAVTFSSEQARRAAEALTVEPAAWVGLDFGQCQKEASSGDCVRTRKILCMRGAEIVNKKYCDAAEKPREKDKCVAAKCADQVPGNAFWLLDDWQACGYFDGGSSDLCLKTREVTCIVTSQSGSRSKVTHKECVARMRGKAVSAVTFDDLRQVVPKRIKQCTCPEQDPNNDIVYDWKSEPWTPCRWLDDTTCSRARSVSCQFVSNGTVVDDSNCLAANKPTTSEACDIDTACPAKPTSLSWQVTPWRACLETDTPGVCQRKRGVVCTIDNVAGSPDVCLARASEAGPMPATTESCTCPSTQEQQQQQQALDQLEQQLSGVTVVIVASSDGNSGNADNSTTVNSLNVSTSTDGDVSVALSLSVDPTSLPADLNEAQFALQQKLDEIRHSLWLALNDSSVNESSIQITEVYYQDPFGVRSRLLDDSGVGMDVQMAVVPDFAAANDTTTAPPGTTTPVSTTTAPSNSTSPPSTTSAPVTQGPTQTTPPDDDDDDDSVAGFQIATAVVSALLLTVWQL